ncbi:MAG: ATP-binding protein [Candidatus Saccharibacteria bacterium]|nr:ATP-binding protein [Candidatus Saccharibacteria bacterium]
MEEVTRPILYHGYRIDDNCEIDYRIAREPSAEIYKLTNNKYLYLILDPSRIIRDENVSEVSVDGKKLKCVVSQVYNRHKLEKLLDDSVSPVGLDAVAGMFELKNVLIEDVVKPFRNPEKYRRFKVSVPNGILLYGPPGCGKTFIVQKLAEELGYNFIELKHSDIASSYLHGTTQLIRETFDKARSQAPTVLFIDEIDGLAPNRGDVSSSSSSHKQEEINELLLQFNNAAKDKILIIAATNRPQLLDPAIVRPGRMDYHVYVGPPDYEARLELFKMYLKGRPVSSINYEKLANETKGYASVDIRLICDNAARHALISEHDTINDSDFAESLRITPSSLVG